VRAQLARFGLDADRAETPVGNLSGGEKARLLLALATRDAPQLLILDEPTNHLDIDAREALVKALADFQGAVLLITHDPHLVELVADRLWLVADGTARPFDGDIDDYRKLIASAGREAPAPARQRAAKPVPDKPPTSKPPAPKPPAPKSNGAKPSLSALRRAARDAETRVATLTAEKESLDRDLADPAIYKNGGSRLIELQRRHGHAAAALAAAEASWLELAQALEDATRAS
jgi:ATP-binding cassette subfamily F protein 3